MRALKIYDQQNFIRGGNSYKKLKIGSHKPRQFKHGDRYKDENNYILTYNKYVDEFWYDEKNIGKFGDFLDIQAQYVYDNPDMFTRIVESQEFIQGGNAYDRLDIGITADHVTDLFFKGYNNWLNHGGDEPEFDHLIPDEILNRSDLNYDEMFELLNKKDLIKIYKVLKNYLQKYENT